MGRLAAHLLECCVRDGHTRQDTWLPQIGIPSSFSVFFFLPPRCDADRILVSHKAQDSARTRKLTRTRVRKGLTTSTLAVFRELPSAPTDRRTRILNRRFVNVSKFNIIIVSPLIICYDLQSRLLTELTDRDMLSTHSSMTMIFP
jgi:hypothetical protein